MTPTCQHHGCDALSETKVKEIIGGKRVDKSETFTAFTWEKTDRAEALRSEA